ncbi:MAG: amidohydrolase family protein [Methanomicrobiales archaeon]|nr:amidohydrolase family protein [Methanomicrobiales archaeon]
MTGEPDREEIFRARGGILILAATLGEEARDIYVGEHGLIEYVGTAGKARFGRDAAVTLDGRHHLVLPGLVNTHTHAAMTLLRGYADDMPLQEWLTEKIWPLEAHLTKEDVYEGTRLACLEMIRSGTTAFNDMYFHMEDAARAASDAGIRATLAYGFLDMGDPAKREKECRATEALVRHVKGLGNPRIRAAVGPHAVYTVSPEGLQWCAGFAREQGIGIHVHLSETEQEVRECMAARGVRPVAHLDRCGCLTPRTVAAHCCWLDREECGLLAERGVSASHNPTSNMKLAVGRAMPCHWMREAGARVTLGTDGAASNNSLDMFGAMKDAALLQKFFWNRQTLLPAPEALAMATEEGAHALGTGPGRIETGAPADLILVSTRTADLTPVHHPASTLVYACTGGSVQTVICDGRVLMHDRVVPGEREILEAAETAARDLVSRARS